MPIQEVPPSLRELIADSLEISPEDVTPETSSETLDTWDSFRHLQLILSIEGEYGVQFDPAEIPDLTTAGKLQAALEKKGVQLQ